MTTSYRPSDFESSTAARWYRTGTYTLDPSQSGIDGSGNSCYALAVYPYPHGDLHLGQVRAYTIHDVLVRHLRMTGRRVLNPIGWQGFHPWTENAVRRTSDKPEQVTAENVEKQRATMVRLGFSFNWNTQLVTSDAHFYRWTQWLFLELLDAGLVYSEEVTIDWCDSCQIYLEQEEVLDNRCQCSAEVAQKTITRWFCRIADYADELLDELDAVQWPERFKTLQRDRIGRRSENVEIAFRTGDASTGGQHDQAVVSTARPETLLGATFLLFSPHHPLVTERMGDDSEFALFLNSVSRVSTREPPFQLGKTFGQRRFRLNFDMINPLTGEHLPAFAAENVSMDVDGGVTMGVPACDQRAFEFADQEGLENRVIIRPTTADGDLLDEFDPATMTEAYPGPGVMVRSGDYDGMTSQEARERVLSQAETNGWGQRRIEFDLRDWSISRLGSFGAPIPIVHCFTCGEVPVPPEELPVSLPDDLDWHVQGSPLDLHPTWKHDVTCPRCGSEEAARNVLTIAPFLDSSWYFLRYLSPHSDDRAWPERAANAWLPVDWYSGGIEHMTNHLLYCRFIVKAMRDRGHLVVAEPFQCLLNNGSLTNHGRPMSKSKGNLVVPEEVYEEFGADTLRATMLFACAPERDMEWTDASPKSLYRWLSRIWRLTLDHAVRDEARISDAIEESAQLRKATAAAIFGVSKDIEARKYNTGIAKLMTLTNAITGATRNGAAGPVVRESLEALLLLLAPSCPLITEELWNRLGNDGSVHDQSWPTADESLLEESKVEIVIQIDGRKVSRARITPLGDTLEATLAVLKSNPDLLERLLGQRIGSVKYVPRRVLNFVGASPLEADDIRSSSGIRVCQGNDLRTGASTEQLGEPAVTRLLEYFADESLHVPPIALISSLSILIHREPIRLPDPRLWSLHAEDSNSPELWATYERPIWARSVDALLASGTLVASGRKGMGKTSLRQLVRHLVDVSSYNTSLSEDDFDSFPTELNDYVQAPDNSGIEYQWAWSLVILRRLLQLHLRRLQGRELRVVERSLPLEVRRFLALDESERNRRRLQFDQLRISPSFASLKFGEAVWRGDGRPEPAFRALAETMVNAVRVSLDPRHTYVVVLDDLDRGMPSPAHIPSLTGLLRSLEYLHHQLVQDGGQRLILLALLRDDVLESIRYEKKSRLLDRTRQLYWSTSQSAELSLFRATTRRLNMHISDADDADDQVWDRTFHPEAIPSGQDPFSYIAMRTRLRPRDALGFLREIISAAARDNTHRVDSRHLIEGEKDYSARFVEEISDEVTAYSVPFSLIAAELRHMATIVPRRRTLESRLSSNRFEVLNSELTQVEVLYRFGVVGWLPEECHVIDEGTGTLAASPSEAVSEANWSFSRYSTDLPESCEVLVVHPGLWAYLDLAEWRYE